MPIVFLSSRYSRREEMREIRDRIHTLGHKVQSRWIDAGVMEPVVAAIMDKQDAEQSDIVISFTGGGRHGGRHVEFGIGIALGKLSAVVGEREHVFHHLPGVYHFTTIEELFQWMAQLC